MGIPYVQSHQLASVKHRGHSDNHHSVELRPPAPQTKQFLSVPFKHKHKDAVLSKSEESPNSIVRPIKDDQNIIKDELSYDIGQKQDFQDLPSLPMDEAGQSGESSQLNGNLRGSHRAFLGNYKIGSPIAQHIEYSSVDRTIDASIELELNNVDSIRVQSVLVRNGFNKMYTKRA